MNCLICSNNSNKLFSELVLNKYDVAYYKCSYCGFIQTQQPYWLNEAYDKAITNTDIGLLSRNIDLHKIAYDLIIKICDYKRKFLDYGGGYGILVRLLRDKGLDFYRQDIFCENIFAVNHDIEDLSEEDRQFELVTCFEVFEHTDNPHELLDTLATYAPNILISTLLIPNHAVLSADEWWYISPHTGQHISFYTEHSLSIIAKKHNLHFYTNGQNLHLFTKFVFKTNPLIIKNDFRRKLKHKVITFLEGKKPRLDSLIENDVKVAKNIKN